MAKLLAELNLPQDLKRLGPQERRQLAQEIRETIVNTVCKNSGHLASGLGSVEIFIAVHTVFDSPRDKIVLDTGHQGYPHKLLTGRYHRFHTLRQLGGISGFPKRDEASTIAGVLGTVAQDSQQRWASQWLANIGSTVASPQMTRVLTIVSFVSSEMQR